MVRRSWIPHDPSVKKLGIVLAAVALVALAPAVRAQTARAQVAKWASAFWVDQRPDGAHFFIIEGAQWRDPLAGIVTYAHAFEALCPPLPEGGDCQPLTPAEPVQIPNENFRIDNLLTSATLAVPIGGTTHWADFTGDIPAIAAAGAYPCGPGGVVLGGWTRIASAHAMLFGGEFSFTGRGGAYAHGPDGEREVPGIAAMTEMAVGSVSAALDPSTWHCG